MIPHTNGMSKAICPECKFENWYDTAHMQELHKGRYANLLPTKVECGRCKSTTVKINNQKECEWHKVGEGIEREAIA